MTTEAANEPVAWWIIGIIVMALLTIAGFLMARAYGRLSESIDGINKTIQGVLGFLAKQEVINEENEKRHTEMKKDIEKHHTKIGGLLDDMTKIKVIHQACPTNPYKEILE